jgi:two-component system, chemotaxis family, response regulator Rcp1
MMGNEQTTVHTHEQRNITMPSLNILLVEDNPADAYLTTMALQEAHLCNELHVVEYGEHALSFLRHQEPYTEVSRPDLIILDLNLPRMNGLEVLSKVKADPAICTIPVVVFSTSQAEQDISQAYRLGVVQYFVKPNDLQECLLFGHSLARVWQRLTNAGG